MYRKLLSLLFLVGLVQVGWGIVLDNAKSPTYLIDTQASIMEPSGTYYYIDREVALYRISGQYLLPVDPNNAIDEWHFGIGADGAFFELDWSYYYGPLGYAGWMSSDPNDQFGCDINFAKQMETDTTYFYLGSDELVGSTGSGSVKINCFDDTAELIQITCNEPNTLQCDKKEAFDGDPVHLESGRNVDSVTDLRIPGNTMNIEFTRLYYGNSFDTGFEHKYNFPKKGTKFLVGTDDPVLKDDLCQMQEINSLYTNATMEILAEQYGDTDNCYGYTFMEIAGISVDPNLGYVGDPNDGAVSLYDYDSGTSEINVTCNYYHSWLYPEINEYDPNGNVTNTISAYRVLTPLGTNEFDIGGNYCISPYSCRVGKNWTHNYNIYLSDTGKQYIDNDCEYYDTLRLISGTSSYDFKRHSDDSGPYINSKYPDMLVYESSGCYTVYKKDGVRWIFDEGPLSDGITYPIGIIKDKFDNQLTFEHDTNGLLTKVTNDAGRFITLHYDDTNFMLDNITDNRNRGWNYTRDSNFDLVSVASPAPEDGVLAPVSQYTYTSINSDYPHQLLTKKDAVGQIWMSNTYNTDGRIVSQLYGNDSFENDYVFDVEGNVDYVTVTDRAGNDVQNYLTKTGLLDKRQVYTAEHGWLTTDYVYDFDLDENLDEEAAPCLLKQVILPSGQIFEYTHDQYGNITSETHKANVTDLGLTTTYTYTGGINSYLNSVTTPDGNQTSFDYNGNYLLTQISLPESLIYDPNSCSYIQATPKYNFGYDAHGNVSFVEMPDGSTLTLSYMYNGDKVDFLNVYLNYDALWQYDYDLDSGLLTQVTDPNGVTTNYDYNNIDRLTDITNGLGELTKISYNPLGLVSQISSQLGSSYNENTAINYSFSYSITDKLQTLTDSLGRMTEIGYTANDKQAYFKDPKAGEENFKNKEYAYNSRDLLKSITLPEDYDTATGNQNITTMDYDVDGRLERVIDASGGQTDYSYDGYGRLKEVIYPDNKYEIYTYDEGSKITSFENMTIITYYNYGAGYNLQSQVVENKSGTTPGLVCNDLNSIVPTPSQWYMSGSSGYNETYFLSSTSGAFCMTGLTATKSCGYLIQVYIPYTGFTLGCVQYSLYGSHIPTGNVITMNQGNQEPGWVTLGFSDSIDYNSLTIQVNRISGTVAVDAFRIIPYDKDYLYDIMGNVLSVQDNTNSKSQNYSYYSNTGLLHTEFDSQYRSTGYQYYPSGKIKKLTYPDGYYVNYFYDAAGRLDYLTDSNGETVLDYTRDASGRVISKFTIGVAETVYDYEDYVAGDNKGTNLKWIGYYLDSTLVKSLTYTRDDVGNITGKNNGSNLESYFYDKNYWLIFEDESEYHSGDVFYQYDNMLMRDNVVIDGTLEEYSSSTTSSVQYSEARGVPVEYDANGNMSRFNWHYYSFDNDNRLKSYYKLNGPPTSGTKTFYDYDAVGRRISKATATGMNATNGIVYETYAYAGGRVIAEYDGVGNLQRRFVYGEGIDEVVAMINIDAADGETYYGYFADELGSVTALYSENTNAIVESYTYDAYGRTDTASAYGNPYRFAGRRFDPESKLYYYRARMYNPKLGVFLSFDPLGYIDSMNMYAYCTNNPTNFIDPWGEATIKHRPISNKHLAKWASRNYGKDNPYYRHWQIFYEDGSNSGYFNDSQVHFDLDIGLYDQYKNLVIDLNDEHMKKAERRVQKRWTNEERKYNYPHNSCQTYIIEVLREYHEIQRELGNSND